MILDTFFVFLGIPAVAGKCISERLYHNKQALVGIVIRGLYA